MATSIRKRSDHEHPHERMARERRRALLIRRLVIAGLVLLVTIASVGGSLMAGS